jgi:two-component system OmpR family response regulator
VDPATPDTKAYVALITYLVEDNETIARNLIDALAEIAAVKVTGLSATQAEASRWLAVHDGEWNLAIVDLFLQQGSGLGVLAGCRNRESYQKVVVLTNYATDEIRRQAALLGADAVFDKSAELDDLFDFCIAQTANSKTPEVAYAQRQAMERVAKAGSAVAYGTVHTNPEL